MTFDTQWILDASAAPEEHAALAQQLSSFATGDADLASAKALAGVDADALIALAGALQHGGMTYEDTEAHIAGLGRGPYHDLVFRTD